MHDRHVIASLRRRLARLVAACALLLAALPGVAAEFRSTTEAVTVWYDAPSDKSKRLFVVNRGYPVEVLVALERWTKVRDAGGSIGWVEARSLGTRRMVVVKSQVAEVRSAPGEGAPVAYRVGQSVLLEWMETLPGGWTRVRHAEAGIGFVRSAEVFGT